MAQPIDLVSKNVTDADFNDKYTGTPLSYAILPRDAVLPKGKTHGSLYIKFTYFNSAHNKEFTEDRTNESIQVVYIPGTLPVYCYKIESDNMFIFMQPDDELSDSYKQKDIVFFAFPSI